MENSIIQLQTSNNWILRRDLQTFLHIPVTTVDSWLHGILFLSVSPFWSVPKHGARCMENGIGHCLTEMGETRQREWCDVCTMWSIVWKVRRQLNQPQYTWSSVISTHSGCGTGCTSSVVLCYLYTEIAFHNWHTCMVWKLYCNVFLSAELSLCP